MSGEASTLIRPSSLPKLAECRAYVSTSGTSEAAERGTKLDGIIRNAWSKLAKESPDNVCLGDIVSASELSAEDEKAVAWAMITMNNLCGGVPASIETCEEQLQAVVPVEGVQPGTMDGLCVERGFLVDFKTGQIRDYKAQMAAYALACMDAYFADTWTAHLLFIDQQIVVTHNFTEAEARALVEGIVNTPAEPTACEYCSWCASFGTCPLTRTQVAEVMEVGDELPKVTPHAKSTKALPPTLEEIAGNDRLAWEFLAKFATVKDWVDIIKDKIRERMEKAAASGTKNAYFSLQNRRGKRVFPARGFDDVILRAGNMYVLSICGPASVDDARKLWEERIKDKPFPEDRIIEQGASTVLQRKSAKAIPSTPES